MNRFIGFFLLLFWIVPAWGQGTPNADAIRSAFSKGGVPGSESADMYRFYQARKFRPAWFGYANNDRIDAALLTLAQSDQEGLEPSDYKLEELKALRHVKNPVEFELQLSSTMLQFAKDLYLGRLEMRAADKDVDLPLSSFDAAAVLEAAIATGKSGGELRFPAPDEEQYRLLKTALVKYRAIRDRGGWFAIERQWAVDNLDKAASEVLEQLYARLATEDEVVAGTPNALIGAIKRYQGRNGLEIDGKVGPLTLAALNIPVTQRIAAIKASMERWRWIAPADSFHILVNVPAADLIVRKDKKILLSSRVIVGKAKTPTPIFKAKVTAVTVNPPWDVPTKIAREELLPKIKKDAGYMKRHHMIFTESGTIRQLPGSDNALGSLKLEMPNRFTTYLHDTSSRALFENNSRFLSHGCIRVEKIQPLAELLIVNNVTAGESLSMLLDGKNTVRVGLQAPVTVYVGYWTAFFDPNGQLNFRPDVYGRDRHLIALFGRQFSEVLEEERSGTCQ